MTISRANAEDIPLIRSLAEKSWRAAYRDILSAPQIDYMLETLYSVEAVSGQMAAPGFEYYLISDGKAVGFLAFELNYSDRAAKLHRLYLVPEAKGRGLGRRALDFVKEKARAAGQDKILLNVNKFNTAREIYLSQGFEVCGEEVIDIGGGYVMDDYIMEFRL